MFYVMVSRSNDFSSAEAVLESNDLDTAQSYLCSPETFGYKFVWMVATDSNGKIVRTYEKLTWKGYKLVPAV